MRWGSNGGWNRSHGTVEKTPRLDSFALADGNGWIMCGHKVVDTFLLPGGGVCELFPVWASDCLEIGLSEKVNGYGGSQRFFLCPACGRRVRYLYQAGAAFLCRKCARLNYRSQQETRSDSMYFYHKGMALADRYLAQPLFRPDGFTFCRYLPERPRYMRQTTYRRYLERFLRCREKHTQRQLEDMAKILGMRK